MEYSTDNGEHHLKECDDDVSTQDDEDKTYHLPGFLVASLLFGLPSVSSLERGDDEMIPTEKQFTDGHLKGRGDADKIFGV